MPDYFDLQPFTADDKSAFCRIFSDVKSITEACKSLNISRATFEYHKRQDRWFKAMLEACKEVHHDDLEAVAYKTGLTPEGVRDRWKILETQRKDIWGKPEQITPTIQINIDSKTIAKYDAEQCSIEAEIVSSSDNPSYDAQSGPKSSISSIESLQEKDLSTHDNAV